MNLAIKLTLDGLISALRWREIDYLEGKKTNFALGTRTPKNGEDTLELAMQGDANGK